ncbi:Putative D-arabinono-1,4-lactone oxidase [Fulvia fulva]|uniref:D-arabinono-1,4-lactone oxidase n=1 Tax=Passalora fulva TaxID=5499 RepID=A0A9Q8LB01_PASFU|nr:Putative D-arabinono-1,4-lactone oxidase [Fulvia fulva]KAK4630961.1 putative D-arabinono-1,4-lactone oxidase [Fulvia fulva]KAK4633246.1 putative D-arabinono-1,4-lactone oxidase [Fulvia fulva]UJO13944.1 Putative D-arabinono-1,4-lactone oxidase [Fulvia fulva]WPV11049.1 Putative D-arabinono-1,4-lactone oxidase [Fulvia fulva]WPV25740.1 Putative D-arabinono-1,4-lactone oxidase [Fulvia fulva]
MNRMPDEVAKTDPDVAFRATDGHVHHTWAKTFQSRPELYIKPQSLEEVQKIVNLARRCRKRIVVVGCGHSPSDLTCSSSWMVNLDDYGRVLKVDKQEKTLLVEAGIRLRDLNEEANRHGLTMKNLGSINDQSIAGAIATATHGSSLEHGLMSESVKSLRIVLANGQAVRCSKDQNADLFRAGLISLGALGIIVEVEFEMIDACKIEWEQQLVSLQHVLSTWDTTLWTQKEYTRVWWMPYMKRAIVWSAEKTEKPLREPVDSWYGGSIGFHTYHNLLWLSNFVPSILPWIEWFVFGMQYGFSTGSKTSAVEELKTGLLMNCLYSQFVNEWALPLSKGPEAISRLSAWINREPESVHHIPFSIKGLYVHCPIEVRVSDTSKTTPRPFLDNTVQDEPTLYLNATLYRAYLKDPPCWRRYYEAFEWLMQEMGAKPHYAKNFSYTSSEYLQNKLGESLTQYLRVRNEADPEGMFLGEWHRRTLGAALGEKRLALEEQEVHRQKARDGGQLWIGEVNAGILAPDSFLEQPIAMTEKSGSPGASSSASSFDFMQASEMERSTMFTGSEYDDEGDLTDRDDARYHGNPKQSVFGTKVFDKM